MSYNYWTILSLVSDVGSHLSRGSCRWHKLHFLLIRLLCTESTERKCFIPWCSCYSSLDTFTFIYIYKSFCEECCWVICSPLLSLSILCLLRSIKITFEFLSKVSIHCLTFYAVESTNWNRCLRLSKLWTKNDKCATLRMVFFFQRKFW